MVKWFSPGHVVDLESFDIVKSSTAFDKSFLFHHVFLISGGHWWFINFDHFPSVIWIFKYSCTTEGKEDWV